MLLKELEKNWDVLAENNAPYFILSKNKKWDIEEFFKTGVVEIEKLMTYIKTLEPKFNRALDFGCGIGRLSQSLSTYYSEILGIDISSVMIEKANLYNKYLNCKFLQTNNINCLRENYYDLVYSNITLQHMCPEFSKRNISGFFRIVSIGGYVIFQLPYEGCRAGGPFPRMEMYSVPKEEVLSLAGENIELVELIDDYDTGPGFRGYRYVFRKI